MLIRVLLVSVGLLGVTLMGVVCQAPVPAPGTPAGDQTLKAIAGLEFYSERGCAACHCNDAVGGCNLDAPNLQGVANKRLSDMVRGDQVVYPHPMKLEATDTELENLGVFLNSLVPGARIEGNSLVTQGYALYVSGGCIQCHLSSGQGRNQGGLGVAIAGTDPDNVYAALSGDIPCHPRQRSVPEMPAADCRPCRV
jgi:mono/diheme cytochrome c family protein